MNRKARNVRAFAAAAVVIAILAFSPASLPAQESNGRILGTVLDSTEAGVPNAQIIITNQDTGVVRDTMSSGDGLYNVPQVPAGTYTIEASAQGFSRAEVKGVIVIVATDTRVNLILQVGSVTQSVEVTGVAPMVDTTSSAIGGVVDEQRVSDLPLNGRNWTDLTLMQPGIAQVQITSLTGNAVLAGYNGMIFISNGATDRSNNYLLDGASMVNFAGLNNSSMSNTSLGVDGIKEYKVVTNMASAEYGMRMGSQTIIVSKGGTNQFHGDAFDYLRNSALDARNMFDALDTTNSNGFGTNKSLPYPGKRIPPFQRNNFGGSFGGPIRKDKTFVEAVYEGIIQNQAGNSGQPITLTTLPKACFVDQNNVLQPKVPASITNVNQFGTCVTGAVNGAAVPAIFTVDPLTLPWADLYPQPNVTGYTFNYTFAYLQPTTEHYGQVRVDNSFSNADNAFFRYTYDVSDSTSSASFPGFVTNRHSLSQFVTASEDHIFSSAVLNTARFSYSRTLASTKPTDVAPATVANNLQLVQNTPFGPVIGGMTPGSGVSATGTGATYSIAGQDIFSWSDDVFWTKGKHALKFGGLVNHYVYNPTLIQGGPGSIAFSGLGNFFGINEGTNGMNYSSFGAELPGLATNGFQFSNDTFGVYAQDDFRVKPRLTLNLGLRYEIATPPQEAVPSLRCSYRTPADTTCEPGDMFKNNTWHNFSPRLGFAWDVLGKGTTSVRGGAGILYDVGSYGFLMYTNVQQTPPLVTFISVTNASVNPTTKLAVPLPTTGVTQSPRIVDYNLGQPTLYQYNLQIQQQLPWGMALTMGYVGSRGTHLYQLREANPVKPIGLTATGLPIYGCWNASQTANSPVTGTGACPAGFTNFGPRLYASTGFSSETFFEADGDSWYNAGELQVIKRTTHGFQFQASYTYAHHIDDGQGLSANEAAAFQYQLPLGYNESHDRGPSVFDIRHNFRANLIYHVPNLTSKETTGKFLNGWWVSSIASAQTGIPLTPILNGDRQLASSAIYEHPNLDPSFDPAKAVTGLASGWINNSMFDLPPAGQLGNAGRGILRGPGQVNFDFSIVKDIKVGILGEAGMLQFRTEIFNLLNHANLGVPANVNVWQAPSAGPGTAPAGQIGTASVPVGFSNPSVITSTANTARQIQFALKAIF